MSTNKITTLTVAELKKKAMEKSRKAYQKARDNGTLKPALVAK